MDFSSYKDICNIFFLLKLLIYLLKTSCYYQNNKIPLNNFFNIDNLDLSEYYFSKSTMINDFSFIEKQEIEYICRTLNFYRCTHIFQCPMNKFKFYSFRNIILLS